MNEDVGRTFAAALRSFLRQDPDVILVGEIRDLETAQISVRAALTGHLVLSTLHTNDCPSTITRLLDMGIPPFLVASSLAADPGPATGRARSVDSAGSRTTPTRRACVHYGHVPTGNGRRASSTRARAARPATSRA